MTHLEISKSRAEFENNTSWRFPPATEILQSMALNEVTPVEPIANGPFAGLWRVYYGSSRESGLFQSLQPVWKSQIVVVERFHREGEVLQQLSGPRFLRILQESIGELPARLFGHFKGLGLEQVLREAPVLSPEFAVWIARQTVS